MKVRTICLVVAWLMSAPLQATILIPLSDEDLVRRADHIVIGRCVDAKSVWHGRQLVTEVTVAVTENLKGTAGETLTVTVPGGIDAKRKFPVAAIVAGAPVFSAGEEVLLFSRISNRARTALW